MPCPKSVTAVFQGIAFSDPNFPWGDVNGSYSLRKIPSPPPGFCQFYFSTAPDSNGVWIAVSVTTNDGGNSYFHLGLALYRWVTNPDGTKELHEVLIFNNQGPSIPLQNFQPQYGGTGTLA